MLREVIMMTHARNTPLNYDVDLRELARLTEWWSAKELMELIAMAPLDRSQREEGLLTVEILMSRIRLMGSNVHPENRARRMHELFQFTASHGTSQSIREGEIKYRFGPEFTVPLPRKCRQPSK